MWKTIKPVLKFKTRKNGLELFCVENGIVEKRSFVQQIFNKLGILPNEDNTTIYKNWDISL